MIGSKDTAILVFILNKIITGMQYITDKSSEHIISDLIPLLISGNKVNVIKYIREHINYKSEIYTIYLPKAGCLSTKLLGILPLFYTEKNILDLKEAKDIADVLFANFDEYRDR